MLPEILTLRAKPNVRLAAYSWWGIGGDADWFIDVSSIEHLRESIALLKRLEMPFCIIGRGTNLLFDDAGYRGCVLRIGEGLSSCECRESTVLVEAGCWTPNVVWEVARHGLSGIEHAIGIPASFGGLICMNGGSQRRGIGENLTSVTALDQHGNLIVYSSKECGFSYRSSRFQDNNNEVIVSAELKLQHRPYAEQRKELLGLLSSRRRKFPRKLPSCGSVFKSDPAMYDLYGPPGQLIEKLGYKGVSLGSIQVSPLHANFIVNNGEGASHDVLALVSRIYESALEETGYELHCEFKYLHPTQGFISPVGL